MDEDKCQSDYYDNIYARGDVLQFPSDLDNDVCMIIIEAGGEEKENGEFKEPRHVLELLSARANGLTGMKETWEAAVKFAMTGQKGCAKYKDSESASRALLGKRGAFCYTKDKGGVIQGSYDSIFPRSIDAVKAATKGGYISVFATGGPVWNANACKIEAKLRLDVCTTCQCANKQKNLIKYDTQTKLLTPQNGDCKAWFVQAGSAFMMHFNRIRNVVLFDKMKGC